MKKKSRPNLGLVSFEVDERSTKMLEFIEPKIAPETLGLVQMSFFFCFFGAGGLLEGAKNISENATSLEFCL